MSTPDLIEQQKWFADFPAPVPASAHAANGGAR